MKHSGASLAAWETFLRGRVAQEEGNVDEALKSFDEALRAAPENMFFLAAKANALQAKGELRGDSSEAVARLERRYAQVADRLTGDRDDPDAWISELHNLLETASGAGRVEAAVTIAW